MLRQIAFSVYSGGSAHTLLILNMQLGVAEEIGIHRGVPPGILFGINRWLSLKSGGVFFSVLFQSWS